MGWHRCQIDVGLHREDEALAVIYLYSYLIVRGNMRAGFRAASAREGAGTTEMQGLVNGQILAKHTRMGENHSSSTMSRD